MSLAHQLEENLGTESVLAEELALLERSGSGAASGVGVAMGMLQSAMATAYPNVDKSEVDGIVTTFVGRAMRELRARNKK